jgi:hypothetical protein
MKVPSGPSIQTRPRKPGFGVVFSERAWSSFGIERNISQGITPGKGKETKAGAERPSDSTATASAPRLRPPNRFPDDGMQECLSLPDVAAPEIVVGRRKNTAGNEGH